MIILKKKYIGILGGTFDPPHSGHYFISKFALIRLGLDEIWWVVTVKNPLKNTQTDFSYRQKNAEFFPKTRMIKVIRIKEKEKTINFSIDRVSKSTDQYFLESSFRGLYSDIQ